MPLFMKAGLAALLALSGCFPTLSVPGAKTPAVSIAESVAAAPTVAHPANPVTRAEFAAMLNEAFQYSISAETSGKFPFTDVPRHHPARAHLFTAWQIGYLRGHEDGKAEPDRPVTRQEAAVMISGLPELNHAALRLSVDLADGDDVAAWARYAVYRMAGMGWLPAGEDGRFRPAASLTREEASFALKAATQWLASGARALPRLKISEDGRHFVRDDGEPFFWLGDTAWELAGRLDRQEAARYLESAARHGFTVVKFVLITEMGRLAEPNAYGDFPLRDKDPARPAVTPGNDPEDPRQYDYWDHVDFILDTAESLGLYAALLPSWGSYLWKNDGQRADPLFNPDNAGTYGEWLGKRYGNRSNIIWVLGGDRIPDTDDKRAIIRSMAEGLKAGGADQLMTYHPWGGASSSAYFHDEAWLDFNVFQSGHRARNDANDRFARRDYALSPAKPTLDLEPRYEAHPIDFDPGNGRFDAYDVRQAAYWSVFAGSAGHSYGHHQIWQMHAPGRRPSSHPEGSWQEALDAEGRASMKWLRALFESYPARGRAPDPALAESRHTGGARVTALSGDGHAFVYSSAGKPFTVNLSRLDGDITRLTWYNPRNGALSKAGAVPLQANRAVFTPPTEGLGQDWVLIMDTRRNP